MINYQKLAFLLIGEQVAPGRYRAELQRWGVVAETAWLGLWIATASPEKYYKFNLNHLALYNYFKLESDPGRYQDVLRGNAIIRRYTGHHHNPHLNLIQTSIDSSLSPVTHPSVREATRGFLKRNHRQVSPPIVDLSQIQFAPVPLVGPTGQSHTVSLPTEPLPIELREYTSWFQWQRGPFTPAVANTGRDREERAGIDLVLPYWMGRHQGAF
jgi:hypothetical protein